MFLYPVKKLRRPGPVPNYAAPGILLCTGAVLRDGPPHFASVVTTFSKTHETKHTFSYSFDPSTNLFMLFHGPFFYELTNLDCSIQIVFFVILYYNYVGPTAKGYTFFGEQFQGGSNMRRQNKKKIYIL